MVEYLSGNRIQGSSALTTSPPATGWKELGRQTLSSSGDVMTTGTITAKDNLMILYYGVADGAMINKLTFNDDTGNNYAYKISDNGGSDSSTTSNAFLEFATSSTSNEFSVADVVNIADQEKLVHLNHAGQNTAGAGTSPRSRELAGKWANTSNAITKVTATNSQSGSFGSGSELVVLGYDNDEADSGATFWEDLADVTLGSAGDTLSSGTITAKKYLWVRIHGHASGNFDNCKIRFNSDSGSNYAYTHSSNGSSFSNNQSDSGFNYVGTNGAEDHFVNMFIFNKSDKEKLATIEQLRASDAGAGNNPARKEVVGKWANTSSQITSVQAVNGGNGDFAAGSRIQVWGAD